MSTVNPMEKWRDMPMDTFFLIDGAIFKKNSALTAQHITNRVLGEIYMNGNLAAKIKPYGETPADIPPDPEKFVTEERPRPESDANYGAKKVTVTPADSPIEQGIQPPSDTGKRKRSKGK